MGTNASPVMLRMLVQFSYKTVTIADTIQLQGGLDNITGLGSPRIPDIRA